MKDIPMLIFVVSFFLYDPMLCVSVYEVYQSTGLTSSDPVYNHEDYNEESVTQKEYDLSGLKRVSPTPKFTLSHSYVSPEAATPHFTRSVTHSASDYADDGYSAFLQNHFDGGDDNGNEEVKEKYQQEDYDNDGDEEVNSNYRVVPDDVEENEHNSYNADNSDEPERIQSLPQKVESGQNSKICKIIVKGNAMCRLCKDPVSGDHSESCSFSSTPPEKKYAYIQKAQYNS